jgi:hypothetical protein
MYPARDAACGAIDTGRSVAPGRRRRNERRGSPALGRAAFGSLRLPMRRAVWTAPPALAVGKAGVSTHGLI